MLYLAGRGSREECESTVTETIASGAALRKFAEMVEAQGGDPAWVMDTAHFPRAAYERKVLAPRSGFITRMDTEALGITSLLLGAGRNTMEDKIDLAAGFYLEKKTGDRVDKGEVLATLYTSKEELLDGAERSFLGATSIEDAPPVPRPLILGHID